MSSNLFRAIVSGILLGLAVVVVHDIWAKHRSKNAVQFWAEAEYKTQSQYGRNRTLEEIRKENEEHHKPQTWLF